MQPATFTQIRGADTPAGLENVLTLTGWSAVAGMFALAAVVLGAVVVGWKRWGWRHCVTVDLSVHAALHQAAARL